MVGPIQVQGLASGINFADIIDQLLSIQRRATLTLQARIGTQTVKKTSLMQVSAALLAFKGAADTLSRPSFYNKTKVTSSNTNVLIGSGTQVGTTGSFTFYVDRLAQSHYLVSNGFEDSDTTSLTTQERTITVEIGGGFIDYQTPLSILNAANGIDRGSIQITDSSGNSAVINLEGAVTVQDVLDKINTNTDVLVNAFVAGDRIVLEDLAGGTPSDFRVDNYGEDTTASDLGILGTGVDVAGRTFIFGNDINYLDTSTRLSILNDGLGVRINADGVTDIAITDTDGVRFEVDIRSSDDTIQEVITRINDAASAAGSSLVASLSQDGVSLQLLDDQTATGIVVSGINSSMAAVDLGLGKMEGTTFLQVTPERRTDGLPSSASGSRLIGYRLIPTLNSLMRRTLNGGQESIASDIQGVRDGSIRITDRQGDQVTLNLSRRVDTTLSADVAAGATSIVVTSLDGFAVGNKFRISQDATTDYRTVTRIDTATNTIYFDEGLSTGFTAASARVFAINESLADIMTVINDRSPVSNVNVSVEFNSETNGLLVVDTSGGTGILAVSGVAGSYTAADLGIQTSGVSSNYFNGTDIDPQYINANTLLSSLNQGKGVYAGKIKITDTNNITFEVDLSQDTDTTIERVITDIDNAAIAHGSGVRARINDTGDGLLIEDTTPGTGTLKIEEVSGGTTAQDLNIEGTAPSATPAIIDGSFEYKVTIDAGSTLEDIKKALNGAGLPITAAVINDGDPITPYKLTILSQTSGRIGRLVVDTDIDVLSFTTTAAAQDSVLLYGTDSGATDPQLITSSKNTITDIVPGLTLNLISTSTSPVTITVTRDLKAIVDQVRRFVETHNSAIAKIDELTYFNTDTYEAGPLFADGTILTIRHSLANMITAPVSEIPTSKLNNLGAVGIKMTNDQKLTFNEATFTDALNNKFEEVRDLFTFQRKLELDTLLSDLNNGAGVDQAVGNDFRIYARNATLVLDIDIQGRTTIGGVLSAINNASGNTGEITAAISADGFSIEITDTSTPQTRDVETPSSTTTFTESDFANVYDDDFFVGATVTFTSGTNNGEVRKVTDFDSSTGLITLDSALPAAPASGDTYIIQRNLQVSPLNNATTAGDLRIQKRMDLDENVLKGDLINLKGDPGVAFRVSEKLDFITKPEETGLISSRIDGIDDIIEGFEKTIDRIEERIERDRERLTRQFASLEMLIAQSQATMARLQALTSGLLAVSGFAIRTGET